MGAFLAGIVMGLAFAACVAVLLLTRRPKTFGFRQPTVWTEEHYRQPPVVTKITVNRHREFEL